VKRIVKRKMKKISKGERMNFTKQLIKRNSFEIKIMLNNLIMINNKNLKTF